MICRDCDIEIFGGKGDYWHVTNSNYGSMKGLDGHLAHPKECQNCTESWPCSCVRTAP